MSGKINIKKLFPEVLKNGKNFHSSYISVKTLSVPNIGKNLFYFVVSGKIIKKAVKRNLFKRRGRYIMRSINIKNGYIYVFFAKKGAEKLTFKELKNEIVNLLKKAKIVI